MTEFEFEIKRSKRITSSTSISIKPDGRVVVSAPKWMPIFLIKQFVSEKKDWIIEHLRNIPKSNRQTFNTGDTLLYFGEQIKLVVETTSQFIRTSFEFSEGQFLVKVSDIHPQEKFHQEIKNAMDRWYNQQGIAVITEKANKYSQLIGVEYSKITLKNVSSIWGSCSYQNGLSFNRKLLMAPHEVVDYVVIHEVSHMVHRNHSSRFWGLVFKYDPQYRQHRRWLKLNSHLLTI